VDTLTAISPADLRSALLAFRDALRRHQEDLNRLNVYPVPDGDTGTNMALTLESVARGLDGCESMEEVCEAIARGSLMGARGNSGVITSQLLRGLSDTFRHLPAIGPGELAAGLDRASTAAYEAVMRPVEGTILTVAREAAAAAGAIAEGAIAEGAATLTGVLEAAAEAARAAVARTPELLPVLAQAGVVDAGGKGFTLLLDAFLHVVDGRPLPEPEAGGTIPEIVEAHLAGTDVAGLRYEVMFFLDAADEHIDAFKRTWGAIGDSIVVVGGDGIWNCHVHTNDIGAAVEAGIEAGRPHEIRITDLFDQVEEQEDWVRHHVAEPPAPADAVTTAVVAVGVGEGVRRLLTSLGVQAVVAGGQSMNPSTEQILEAVEQTNGPGVIVLPNNKNIIPVAQQVDDLCDRAVEVVPTTSVIEALSALVEYDPDAELPANVAAMSEAAGRVRAGEVTRAVRDSVADCGPITEGDWIAIESRGICCATTSAVEALEQLLARLVDDDSEIVTVVVGADADPRDTERIREHLELEYPQVELEFHDGGQPLYPYLVGVE
jgi:DAK2 domain fusion protein YloV